MLKYCHEALNVEAYGYEHYGLFKLKTGDLVKMMINSRVDPEVISLRL